VPRFDAFVSTVLVVGVVALFFAVCMLWQAFVPDNLDYTPNPEARAVYEKRPDNHFERVESAPKWFARTTADAFGVSGFAGRIAPDAAEAASW
jgi:hypothetical protein